MVRFAAKRVSYSYASDEEEEEDDDGSDDEDYGKAKKKKASPAKKKGKAKGRGVRVAKSPRNKISKASSKKSRASYDDGWGDYGRVDDDDYYEEVKVVKKAAAANKRGYRYDDEEQSEEDNDDGGSDYEEDSDDDYRRAPPPAKKGKKANFKRTPAKTSSAKKGRGRPPAAKAAKGRGRPPAKGKGKKKASKYYDGDSEDDVVYSSTTKSGRKSTKKKRKDYVEEYSDSEEEEESESEEEVYYEAPKKKAPPKEQFPPVGEMVVECIKALKDNPKKGSTCGSIKETIAMNWPVNMKYYDSRIKKFILKAVADGTLIQTKGKGMRGRFTVAGWKPPKKKKKKPTTSKKDDVDEILYQPKKTARDEDKEKNEAELEARREELKRKAMEKEMEKANRPVKPRPKNTQPREWEVESVKGSREKGDKTFYQVKWISWPKLTWEPEENLDGCQDLIDAYLEAEEKKEAEKVEYQKLAKEKGIYEVAKILNVEFHHGKREFHVRWKGWGPEGDTMEPEDNLDCPELIEKFMDNWEKTKVTSEKQLREAPKKTVRMIDIVDDGANSSGVRRKKKRRDNDQYGMRGGYRMSYVGMDD